MNHKSFRSAYSRSLSRNALVIAAAIAATPALAEDSSASGAERGEIIVTGTRIREPLVTPQEPLVTLDHSYVEDRNLTNIADALNEVPGVRGSITPAGSQGPFGQGVNFLNLYNLGSNRTLVLVDGRRVVSSNMPTIYVNASPGTQVDLNTIPTILVDRVDIASASGAPVYGTDAIAGTVNLILKRDFTGLDLRATGGITEEGDNFRWNLSGMGGMSFAEGRGHITAALSYDKVNGVLANARDAYRANVGSLANPCTTAAAGSPCATSAVAGYNLVSLLRPGTAPSLNDGRLNPNIGFNDSNSDGFPASILVHDVTTPAIATGGVLSNGSGAFKYRFAPDGSLIPYDRGTIFTLPLSGALAAGSQASGGDGFKANDYAQITSELERINAMLLASYDLDSNNRLFAEALYYNGQANELVQQPSFNALGFSGVSGALKFRTDNPFLSDQARQVLAANGYTSTFQLSRANSDLADLTGWSDTKLYRIVTGLNGSATWGGRRYDYEISVNYGRNDFTDHGQNINQQHFINAVNVAEVNGEIVCSTTPTVTGFPTGAAPVADPNCVPLNLFGNGAASQAALDYVVQELTSHSRLEQFVVNANLGGSPFDIFGNPFSFNLGVEHHEEKARFTPDPFLQAGLGRSVVVAPVSGSYNLDEVFGEVRAPLISPANDLPISSLELFGRVRHVDNSVNGDFTAWATGGSLAPVSGVTFRGNFTRSFRAPSITELFAPVASMMTAVPDICSIGNRNTGPVPEIRSANCKAFLDKYPNASPLIAATLTVPALSGGNPNLENETADVYSYGVVLQPHFLPGLNLTADYLNFDIQDPISSLTVAQIAQACFDNPEFDASDPANGNQFCSLIKRDANGQVVSDSQNPGVTAGFVNGKRIKMSAVQANLDYVTSLDNLGLAGTLNLSGDLFHLNRRVVDITGIAPIRTDGVVGDPKWQGQFRLRYANQSWGFAAHVNYTGKQLISRYNRADQPSDTREFDHFDPFATVDTSVFFNTPEGFRVNLSVTNLFNRIGQEYYGYIIPASINDALGRRFALTIQQTL